MVAVPVVVTAPFIAVAAMLAAAAVAEVAAVAAAVVAGDKLIPIEATCLFHALFKSPRNKTGGACA